MKRMKRYMVVLIVSAMVLTQAVSGESAGSVESTESAGTVESIEPDFFLDKPESFYDRPALVEYLHELK